MQDELTRAYQRYFPLLVQKCARMLRSHEDAQDVAQESFIRLHEAALLGAEPRVVTAWLYRTSTRLAIDRLRARSHRAADPSALDALIDSSASDGASLFRSALDQLVKLVPDDELQAGLLSRVDGLSQAELAEVLGVHERTVRRLLSKFEARIERLRTRSEA
jgi:RNA polymerase sigma-70 factor (ECF subfamily)